MWPAPVVQPLSGDRLHLHQGPIDVVLRAWGARSAVADAYAAVTVRFQTVLTELADELPELRRPMSEGPRVSGPVAKRMVAACRPYKEFVTPMAAVAGAVADELLAVMTEAAPLDKAFVNDGGDIAIHLTEGETLAIGLAGDFGAGAIPGRSGHVVIEERDGVRGVATSGAQGRSFSFGIADSVTVLALDGARADVAATLIANAVDLPGHPSIERRPALELDPDSDLGSRPVTVAVGPLTPDEIDTALQAGIAQADAYRRRGLIRDAALTLRGQMVTLGSARFMEIGR